MGAFELFPPFKLRLDTTERSMIPHIEALFPPFKLRLDTTYPGHGYITS